MRACFSQVPVKPVKTADNDTSLDTSLSDTAELAPAVSDKLTVAEKVNKFSALSASSVVSGSTASSRSTRALETGGIHVQSFVASLQFNLSHNESSSSVDKSLSASKRDGVSTPPKPAKHSVSVVTTSSVSPAPPPLPCRPSSTSLSNRSDSSVQSVTKQFRPPPPIPDEPAASISSHRESLSPHLPFTTSRSESPTARRSEPVIRYL